MAPSLAMTIMFSCHGVCLCVQRHHGFGDEKHTRVYERLKRINVLIRASSMHQFRSVRAMRCRRSSFCRRRGVGDAKDKTLKTKPLHPAFPSVCV